MLLHKSVHPNFNMASGTSVSQLEMQLQSARKSILFMETQHANTLRGLHQEIQQLQKKCSDLTFELAMKSEVAEQENAVAARLAQYEHEVQELMSEKIELVQKVEARERQLVELEEHVKQQEKKYLNQLKIDRHRITALVNELDSRSNTIAYQTMQLQQAHSRLSQKGRQTGGGALAPTPPARPRNLDSSRSSHRTASRSTDAQARPVSSGGGTATRCPKSGVMVRPASSSSAERTPRERRSSGTFVPSPMPDPAPFLTAGEQVAASDPVFVKTRPAVLPPIQSKRDASSLDDINGNLDPLHCAGSDKATRSANARDGEKLALGRAVSGDRKFRQQSGGVRY